ncbi:MAG: hypothetical protein ABSG77_13310 [Candidatus Acidiferrum sp.]|jgi:hypothetical protein
MKQSDQAVLIWSVLALAARMQRVFTYKELGGFTGIARFGLNKALGLIFSYCDQKHYPELNAIVVLEGTGFPGGGYPKKHTPLDFLVERTRVFAFD